MEKTFIKKIEPHFYYNALEYINSLAIIKDAPEISEVTILLGYMMRYWTDNDSEFIKIQRELEYIEGYLKISQMRYNSLFKFSLYSKEINNEECPIYILEPILNDIILECVGVEEHEVNIDIIVVKEEKVKFKITVTGCKILNLRDTTKINNNFIFAENRLEKYVNDKVNIDYIGQNTIITFMV